jgi:hypothetical protein
MNKEDKKVPKCRNKKEKDKIEYDILQLDIQIKECFNEEKFQINEYRDRLVSMVKSILSIKIPYGIDSQIIQEIEFIQNDLNIDSPKNSDVIYSYSEYIDFYKDIKRLILKINNIQNDTLYNKYVELTNPIIENYRLVLDKPVKKSFMNKSKNEDNSYKLHKLTESYMKIAENFIDIDHSAVTNTKISQSNKYLCKCGNNADFDRNEGMLTCEVCGICIPIISSQTSFKDIDRINLHTKFKYDKKSHFKESIMKYQGKQNNYINPIIYTEAEKWMIKHNLLNLQATTKQEKFQKVKKEHVRLFMSESKNSDITKHYEDLNLIYSNLTDTPCPDISHLEEKLYAQFDKIVEAFMTMKDYISRSNILNCQFVLKKLLLYNGYKIDPLEFPDLKTYSRQLEHENLYSELIAITDLADIQISQ